MSVKFVAHHELRRNCQTCTVACSLYHEEECSLSLAWLRVRKDSVMVEIVSSCPTENMQDFCCSQNDNASMLSVTEPPRVAQHNQSEAESKEGRQRAVEGYGSDHDCPSGSESSIFGHTAALRFAKHPCEIRCSGHFDSMRWPKGHGHSTGNGRMTPRGGYAGHTLDVDLTARKITARPTLCADYGRTHRAGRDAGERRRLRPRHADHHRNRLVDRHVGADVPTYSHGMPVVSYLSRVVVHPLYHR